MAKPPRIVLLNGVVDNRENMLDESADQYSEDEANFPELLLNQVRKAPVKLSYIFIFSFTPHQTASCLFSRRLRDLQSTTKDKTKARFGSSAIHVHNEVRRK